MNTVYSWSQGTMLRHHIEDSNSTWYATFTNDTDFEVTYTIQGKTYTTSPEDFIQNHYAAVNPPLNVWAECEILHEGTWKRNPTKDTYVDLTQDALKRNPTEDEKDDYEEILLKPLVKNDTLKRNPTEDAYVVITESDEEILITPTKK